MKGESEMRTRKRPGELPSTTGQDELGVSNLSTGDCPVNQFQFPESYETQLRESILSALPKLVRCIITKDYVFGEQMSLLVNKTFLCLTKHTPNGRSN